MIWMILAGMAFLFALGPAVLYARNVRIFRIPSNPEGALPAVSILIPARNEARSIAAAIDAALRTRGVEFEIVVLDDHSEDETAAIVQAIAAREPRVRLEQAPELPAGWCGKQHACFVLSKLARHPVFCFIDADVRLEPECAALMTGFLQSSGSDLVSGFPRQETATFLEQLLIPLIHFLLLGFLPLARMRQSKQPSLGAGCGQLFVINREAYEKTGGHEMVKVSLHDGLTLPRAYRQQGHATDLCDATYLASCRMYRSAGEVWFGLAKNAREGLAAPRLIVPATLMLLLGQVLPLLLFLKFTSQFAKFVYFGGTDLYRLMNLFEQERIGIGLALSGLALLAMYYPRFDATLRFRQPMESALMHPFGVVMLLAVQWYALLTGRRRWKGRTY